MSNGVAHGDLVLFECPRVRRSEYWQFIKLVAPAGAPPAAGQTHWLSQDASDAFCLKCGKMFRFQKGSSNSVRRHMERFHRKELARYHAQAAAEAAALAGAGKPAKRGKGEAKSEAKGEAKGRRAKREASELGDAAEAADPAPLPLPSSDASQAAAKKPRPAAEQREGEELLLRWLCAGLRPLSTAQDAALAAFVDFLAAGPRGFRLPTFDVVRHRLELSVEGLRFDARQRLKKHAGHVSLAAELWSVRGEAKYAAVVCHMLSEDFVRVTAPLEVVEIPRGDGESFSASAFLSTTLRDWGLHKHQVSLALALPSERGEQDQQCESGEDHNGPASGLRWFQDVLTRLEGDFVRTLSTETSPPTPDTTATPTSATSLIPGGPERDALEMVRTAIVDLKQLVRGCQQFGAVRRKLVELHGAAHGGEGELWAFDSQQATGVSTEPASWVDWSSFLGHAVAWRPAFDALFTFASTDAGQHELDSVLASLKPPSARTWLVAEVVATLLRPLQELHDVLSGGDARSPCVASLPFMLQCLAMVKQQLERDNLLLEARDRSDQHRRGSDDGHASGSEDDPLLAQLELVREWVLAQIIPRPNAAVVAALGWCSTLDPRCARMRHLSDAEREASKATLVDRAAELYLSQLPAAAATSSSESASAASSDPLADFEGDMMYAVGRLGTQPAQGLMHRLLYDDDDDVAATDGLSREAEAEHARLYASNEVDMYLSEHQARKERVSCPLEWWRANRDRYPLLSPLARTWLGAVASTGRTLRHVLDADVDQENRRRARAKTTRDMIYVHVATRQQLVSPPSTSAASSPWPAAAPGTSGAPAQPPSPPFAV